MGFLTATAPFIADTSLGWTFGGAAGGGYGKCRNANHGGFDNDRFLYEGTGRTGTS